MILGFQVYYSREIKEDEIRKDLITRCSDEELKKAYHRIAEMISKGSKKCVVGIVKFENIKGISKYKKLVEWE
jgi:hypothetical protein